MIPHHPRPDKHCPACRQRLPSPRNLKRHNLLFALLEPALHQWPEGHEFQPLDREHLRGWLLCKAGWCEAADITVSGNQAQMVAQLTAFMNAHCKERVYFKSTRRGMRAYKPRSISFRSCREADFRRVLDAVAEIITATIGVPIDQLRLGAEHHDQTQQRSRPEAVF